MSIFDSIMWPVPVPDDPNWNTYPEDIRNYWYSLATPIKKDERLQMLKEYIHNRDCDLSPK